MKKISVKLGWQLFWAVTAVGLMLAQPSAVGAASGTQDTQDESIVQGIERKVREWLGGDPNAQKAPKEVQKKTETPDQKNSSQPSEGRKALSQVKKKMQEASDNLSKAADRDRKVIKKKLKNLFADK